jgi:iron complex transport system substrate-binding protein
VKQQMTLPPQPVNAIVYTAAAHSANLWTAESAQGKLLHQLGFTLADLPAGLQTSKARANATTSSSWAVKTWRRG